ncbi:MAG: hypothetical protein EP329_14940 [Deltaproteobacteria bacterium]|nr:MAG: hypothetical protein EP329_14940 [Deltaproteobacteria bacterium]
MSPRDAYGFAEGTALSHAIEVERELLGAMFLDPARVFPLLTGRLRGRDFYSQAHGLIFEHSLGLWQESGALDPPLLLQRLKERGAWERCGGGSGVREALAHEGLVVNVAHYRDLILDKARRRRMAEAAVEIGRAAHDEGRAVDDIAASARELIDDAQREGGHSSRIFAPPVTADGASWLTSVPPKRASILSQRDEEDPQRGRSFLPAGVVGVFSAPGGTGKSMALLQLAFSVATGSDWFGLVVEEPGDVAIVMAEEGRDELWRRFHRIARAIHGDDHEALRSAAERLGERVTVAALKGRPCTIQNADDPERMTAFGHQLVSELASDPSRSWKLIIIDPLSRFAGPMAEVDNHAATRFVEHLETLTELPGGPAVLLAHHEAKGGKSTNQHSGRGATGLSDGARWAARLEAVEGPDGVLPLLVRLRQTKNSYGPLGPALRLKRIAGGALVVASTSDFWEAGATGEAKPVKPRAARNSVSARAAKIAGLAP